MDPATAAALGFFVAIVAVGFLFRACARTFSFMRILLTRQVSTRRAQACVDADGEPVIVSVFGKSKCEKPILSPVTQTPCLAYRLEVTGRSFGARASDADGKLLTEVGGSAFSVDDGSGPVHVDLRSGTTHSEWSLDAYTSTLPFGKISDGVAELPVLTLGNLELEFSRIDPFFQQCPGIASLRCEEKVFPVTPEVYVCGSALSEGIGDGDYQGVILRSKSRSQVLSYHAGGALVETIATLATGALAWWLIQ